MRYVHGSRKIAPEENCPPALILTLILNQTLTLTGRQFSSGVIFRTPSRNMVGQFKKAYLHRPIKILYFLTPARIQKYFSFFNNKPPVDWVAHITRDFLTCYYCSYYSSMLCTIWYCLNNLNNAKNTHGGVLLLLKVTVLHGCFSHF